MAADVLRDLFNEALRRNSETLEDVITISHPVNVLEEIATLEEI